ncbi:GNAT family N-acetyltransferase [Actinomadura sp. 21ATH]|uniref:GNAT family N-acetyltransferase n=1 Tax=Actinomadura sp. 21ATH TaxID=1735444 RepID=UPI0035C20B54
MSKEISDNAEASRYEIRVDGELAGFAEYRTRPGKIVFTHTEVFDAFEGQGVGGALARGALDGVRAKGGLAVVPLCPFIKGWIDRHPDYQDLVGREGA